MLCLNLSPPPPQNAQAETVAPKPQTSQLGQAQPQRRPPLDFLDFAGVRRSNWQAGGIFDHHDRRKVCTHDNVSQETVPKCSRVSSLMLSLLPTSD